MKGPFAMGYCFRCRKWQKFLDIVPPTPDILKLATVYILPLFLNLLRLFVFPKRCIACHARMRLSYAGVELVNKAQTNFEIDEKLSAFQKGLLPYSSGEVASQENHDINTYFCDSSLYFEWLRNSGYAVGKGETILYVAKIFPFNQIETLLTRSVYLLLAPITVFFYRSRRRKNPQAQWFPIDHRRSGRVILTDKRLVIYQITGWAYYDYYSLPLSDIRAVSQDCSSIVVYLKDPFRPTVKCFVGDDLGLLFWAIHCRDKTLILEPPKDA